MNEKIESLKLEPLKAFKKELLGYKDRIPREGDIYILSLKEKWYRKNIFVVLVLRGNYWIEDKSI